MPRSSALHKKQEKGKTWVAFKVAYQTKQNQNKQAQRAILSQKDS